MRAILLFLSFTCYLFEIDPGFLQQGVDVQSSCPCDACPWLCPAAEQTCICKRTVSQCQLNDDDDFWCYVHDGSGCIKAGDGVLEIVRGMQFVSSRSACNQSDGKPYGSWPPTPRPTRRPTPRPTIDPRYPLWNQPGTACFPECNAPTPRPTSSVPPFSGAEKSAPALGSDPLQQAMHMIASKTGYNGCFQKETGKNQCNNVEVCRAYAAIFDRTMTVTSNNWRRTAYPGGCFVAVKDNKVIQVSFNPNTNSQGFPTWATYRYVCGCSNLVAAPTPAPICGCRSDHGCTKQASWKASVVKGRYWCYINSMVDCGDSKQGTGGVWSYKACNNCLCRSNHGCTKKDDRFSCIIDSITDCDDGVSGNGGPWSEEACQSAQMVATASTGEGWWGCPSKTEKEQCDSVEMCQAYAWRTLNKKVGIMSGWRTEEYPGGCFVDINSDGAVNHVMFNPNLTSRKFPTWATYRYVCGCTRQPKSFFKFRKTCNDCVCHNNVPHPVHGAYWGDYTECEWKERENHNGHTYNKMCDILAGGSLKFKAHNDSDYENRYGKGTCINPSARLNNEWLMPSNLIQKCVECVCHNNVNGWSGDYTNCDKERNESFVGLVYHKMCRIVGGGSEAPGDTGFKFSAHDASDFEHRFGEGTCKDPSSIPKFDGETLHPQCECDGTCSTHGVWPRPFCHIKDASYCPDGHDMGWSLRRRTLTRSYSELACHYQRGDGCACRTDHFCGKHNEVQTEWCYITHNSVCPDAPSLGRSPAGDSQAWSEIACIPSVPAPAPQPENLCANEHHRCEFSGERIIRYCGNGGCSAGFRDRPYKDGVICTSENFDMGDGGIPGPGTCRILEYSETPECVECYCYNPVMSSSTECTLERQGPAWYWGDNCKCSDPPTRTARLLQKVSRARRGCTAHGWHTSWCYVDNLNDCPDAKQGNAVRNEYPFDPGHNGAWSEHACVAKPVPRVDLCRRTRPDNCRCSEFPTTKARLLQKVKKGRAGCTRAGGGQPWCYIDDMSACLDAVQGYPVNPEFFGDTGHSGAWAESPCVGGGAMPGNLEYVAADRAAYEQIYGEASCVNLPAEPPDEKGINWNNGEGNGMSYSCIRFPFGPMALMFRGMQFVGEFQFCNRPATHESFVMLSSGNSDCGISGLGRIDWPCQMGPFNCKIPRGGVVAITRDWLAFLSFTCSIQKHFKKVKRATVFKTPPKTAAYNTGAKAAEKVLNVQGITTFAFYSGINNEQGLDICVALIGGISVEVLSLVGATAAVKGQVLFSTRRFKPLLVTFTIRVQLEVRILLSVFKLTLKVNWNYEEGWFFQFYWPQGIIAYMGDDSWLMSHAKVRALFPNEYGPMG